ncbi:MAG: glycine zipper domain-containing protein [Noviherbaspirillum sp.]
MGSDSEYGDSGQSGGQSGKSMRDELSDMKSDLDALIGKASGLSDRELKMARDQMMAKFGSMRHRARGMADQASQQLNQGMDVTTDYVKEKALQSVAMAAGLGLLIGALLRRH